MDVADLSLNCSCKTHFLRLVAFFKAHNKTQQQKNMKKSKDKLIWRVPLAIAYKPMIQFVIP